MHRQNQSLYKAMNPEFLKDSRQTLRETSDIQPHQDPLEPVMSVSDDILTIRNASHTARNVYLLPMALALIISSFILFHNNLEWGIEGLKYETQLSEGLFLKH